jgi:hypothetical protein
LKESLQTVAPELELVQKTFRTKVSYRFFPNHVEYTIRDNTGALTSFSVKYIALPAKIAYGIYEPPRRQVVVIQLFLMMFLTLLFILAYRDQPQRILYMMAFYSVIGIGSSALLRRHFKTIYTSIPVVGGGKKVLVLRDRRHDEVLKALESRRVRELQKLAVINPLNTTNIEMQKFTWLKDEGVITEQEFNFFRTKLVQSATDLITPASSVKPPGENVQ